MKLRAALVIAAVYGYFLLFAQFSFVELLRSGGASLLEEKVILGTMAVAGIGGGFLAAWRGASPKLLRAALVLAGAAAAVAPWLKTMPGPLGVALVTGAALGIATVSLAALLPTWCGVAWVGVGTGLGYAICNVPAIFTLAPAGQAWVAGGLALGGLLAVPKAAEWRAQDSPIVFPTWGTLVIFTALVWLDSAAFFIIQHAVDLKNGTWGDGLLWRNALIHLLAALAAGVWLTKAARRSLPVVAWGVLAVASLAVNAPETRGFAGWLYPLGVSFYSTALVAWPGWFSGKSSVRQAGWSAAILFTVAGWFGSANGIGMAQTLKRVPPEFIGAAGIAVLLVVIATQRTAWRAAAGVAGVLLVSLAIPKKPMVASGDAIERGRQVYLSEGCIHCHSQYVRRGSLDEEIWGPASKPGEVLKGEPVLIGNRRQGPDLSNVGARRSAAWLKLHFIQPQVFAPGSPMPGYGHLFETGKGDDLVRYLKQGGESGMGEVLRTAQAWSPKSATPAADGQALFVRHCAACHGASGQGNGLLAANLIRKPANLVAGPFLWTPAGPDLDLRVARVVKFGLIGTDMPGHEALADGQVLAIKDWILSLRGSR